MKAALSVCLALALAVSAFADTRQYYKPIDARLEARAAQYFAQHGLAGARARAWRGRLVIGGELPAGPELERLRRELAAATGAISVQ